MSLKDNLIQQAIGKVRSVANYFNPTSNNGNNFWSSKASTGLVKFQQNLNEGKLLPTFNKREGDKPIVKVGKSVANFPINILNSPVSMVAKPTFDIVNMTKYSFQNQGDSLPYSELKSPAVKLTYQAMGNGPKDARSTFGNVAEMGSDLVKAYLLGRVPSKTTPANSFVEAVKTTAPTTAKYVAGYSFLDSLPKNINDWNQTPVDVAVNTGIATAQGYVGGLVAGAVIGGLGYTWNTFKNWKMSDNELGKVRKTLGVNKNASPEEIKIQYRKLAMENHPDRLAQRLGRQPTVQEMQIANNKMAELNNAYKLIEKAIPGVQKTSFREWFFGAKPTTAQQTSQATSNLALTPSTQQVNTNFPVVSSNQSLIKQPIINNSLSAVNKVALDTGLKVGGEGGIRELMKSKGYDLAGVDIQDNANFIVENTSGNPAKLMEIPLEEFGNPKFETAANYKPGRKITEPIEVSVVDGKLRITDGANRFTQARANGDKTILAVVEDYDQLQPIKTGEVSTPQVKTDLSEREIARQSAVDNVRTEYTKLLSNTSDRYDHSFAVSMDYLKNFSPDDIYSNPKKLSLLKDAAISKYLLGDDTVFNLTKNNPNWIEDKKIVNDVFNLLKNEYVSNRGFKVMANNIANKNSFRAEELLKREITPKPFEDTYPAKRLVSKEFFDKTKISEDTPYIHTIGSNRTESGKMDIGSYTGLGVMKKEFLKQLQGKTPENIITSAETSRGRRFFKSLEDDGFITIDKNATDILQKTGSKFSNHGFVYKVNLEKIKNGSFNYDVKTILSQSSPPSIPSVKTGGGNLPVLQTNLIKQELNRRIQSSVEYDPIFKSKVESIANQIGLKYSHGPVKDIKRAVEKVVGEEKGILESLKDYNRSVLFSNNPVKDLDSLLPIIEKEFGQVFRVTNNFEDPESYYKKIIVNVQTPSGLVGEIQITTPEMWDAKIKLGGDILYHKYRVLDPESKEAQRFLRLSKELYLRAATNLSNSSSVIGLPSENALPMPYGKPLSVTQTTSLPSLNTLTGSSSTTKNIGNFNSLLIQDNYTPKGIKVKSGKIKVTSPTTISPKVGGLRTKPNPLKTSQSISTESPTDSLVDAITNPKVKTRKFVETVRESPKTAPEVKQMVQGQYIPKSNDALSRKARNLIAKDIGAARDMALNGLDDESVAVAHELIQYYSSLKDFDSAAVIANKTAENLTAHGRAVQAASLYDKLTPEGIQRYASSVLSDVKMTLKPEDSKRLYDQATKVQKMKPGIEKAMAQQKLMEEVSDLIPTPLAQKVITIWKAGLLTGLKTSGRNVTSNTINEVAEIIKDVPATMTDVLASIFTGKRTKTFTVKGTGRGLAEGKNKGLRLFRTGFDERRQMGKLDIHHVNWGSSKVGKAAKTYTDTVFRFLGAQDQPFYYAALNRSLYDQAGAMAKNAGKSGDVKYIEKLFKNPPDQMLKNAVHDAEVAVFQNNTALSSAINSAKRAIKSKTVIGGAMADFVAPFTGVPSAIITQVVNYTPIGLAKTIIENIGKGKFDQRAFSEGIGRGLTGVGILAIGSALAAAGMMTLDYPKDPKEQAQWKLEGKNEFSIQYTKGGKWHSIGSLGPEASVLLIGGYMENGGPSQAILGGLKQQKEQTFLQGISDLSDAIDNPDSKAKAYFKNITGSMIPTLIGDIAKGIDPITRETNTALESAQAKIPFWRQSLLPQRNVFGEEVPNEQGFLGTMFDITNSRLDKRGPLIDELRRLSDLGFAATPTKLSAKQTIQKMKVELTPEQLDAFEEKAGKLIKQRLDLLIQSPNYQGLTDEKKQKAIQDVTSKTVLEVKNSLDLSSLRANTYTSSADAPKNTWDTFKVYGQGVVQDPGGVINAVKTGQPIRKITGGTVVVERAQGLSNIDQGDKTTQIDHIIPLSLGGDNSPENLLELSVTDHAAKTRLDNYLLREVKAGRMTVKLAQQKSVNWRNELGLLPQTVQQDIAKSVSEVAPPTGQVYQVVNKDTGTVKQIELIKPEYPSLTGYYEVDKKLKSQYSSAVTKFKNNVMSLLEDGQISAKEANDLIASSLSKSKSAYGTSGKKIKVKKISLKFGKVKRLGKIKVKSIKIKKIAGKTYKPVKFKVPKKLKVKNIAIRRTK